MVMGGEWAENDARCVSGALTLPPLVPRLPLNLDHFPPDPFPSPAQGRDPGIYTPISPRPLAGHLFWTAFRLSSGAATTGSGTYTKRCAPNRRERTGPARCAPVALRHPRASGSGVHLEQKVFEVQQRGQTRLQPRGVLTGHSGGQPPGTEGHPARVGPVLQQLQWGGTDP